jgi:hypothetical protein
MDVMAIPESQLETWSHQGAVVTSRDTYATVKRALESGKAALATHKFDVFLQGSYGNDTNIFTESDVDIVICCTEGFFYDLDALSEEQKVAFKNYFSGTLGYNSDALKADVQAALVAAFGASVKPPNKAFKIEANGARRNADVVAAFNHRRYTSFVGSDDAQYVEGISFYTANNKRIDNFPKQHSQNLTIKHQATSGKFKPAVRIFKNMRSKLLDRGAIEKGGAPSYYIEGLLYNVPDDVFAGSYSDMILGILKWLSNTTDRTNFVCANRLFYLLRDNNPVCWTKADGEKFINAAIGLWNNWPNGARPRFI